jgi:putative transposase
MPTPSWPHAPTHQLSNAGTYIITAGTYQKEHHFRGARRLEVLQRGILEVTAKNGWHLEAWAVFSNHYHFVAHSPEDGGAEGLPTMLGMLHKKMATWVNGLDGAQGRKVWHNYWETRLTYQPSYLARLSYVHQNAVRHGLVACANQYPWCSAGFFERSAASATVKSIYSLRIDRVAIGDDFEPQGDWAR